MTTTLSDIARIQLDQTFRALDTILAKALRTQRNAVSTRRSIWTGVWLPTCIPLTKQIQLVSDFSVRGLSRLAGRDPVSMPDDETSFEALRLRLAKAREAIWALDPAA